MAGAGGVRWGGIHRIAGPRTVQVNDQLQNYLPEDSFQSLWVSQPKLTALR